MSRIHDDRNETTPAGDNNTRVMGWLLLLLPPLIALLDSWDGVATRGELIVEFILMVIGCRVLYVNRDRRRTGFFRQISPF